MPATKTVYRFSSYVSYDDEGQCAKVVVYGAGNRTLLGSFPAQQGESAEAVCARAYAAVGRQPDDGVIVIHFVKAGPNGGPAPGFERFAKHA
jgi:hypothetical protein